MAGIAKAGTQGTLAKTLKAISNQVNTLTVVVRVEQGDDESDEGAATTANVIVTVTGSGQYTGLKALLVAQAKLDVNGKDLI
ncbi:hypothetical protein ACLSZ7_04835 [Avibacterium gallinarum]|uniref:hypothetical protein n=2 Tax=Avibacterium TaxID=292486 RepID=UPI003BF8BB30